MTSVDPAEKNQLVEIIGRYRNQVLNWWKGEIPLDQLSSPEQVAEEIIKLMRSGYE